VANEEMTIRTGGGPAPERIAEGKYAIAVGKVADDLVLTAEAPLTERLFGR
jgi:hypothetical protein